MTEDLQRGRAVIASILAAKGDESVMRFNTQECVGLRAILAELDRLTPVRWKSCDLTTWCILRAGHDGGHIGKTKDGSLWALAPVDGVVCKCFPDLPAYRGETRTTPTHEAP